MKTSAVIAVESLCQFTFSGMRRIPKDSFDFGDEETVHASLKRVSYNINSQEDMNDSFGVFCGKYCGKYVVGIMGMRSKYDFHSCEVFNSLEDMKREWQLD